MRRGVRVRVRVMQLEMGCGQTRLYDSPRLALAYQSNSFCKCLKSSQQQQINIYNNQKKKTKTPNKFFIVG